MIASSSRGLLNYRRFEQFNIEFDEQLTVLAANNGCGKTAILDAAAVAFSFFVAELDKSKPRGFLPTDVRLQKISMGQTIRALPAQLDAIGKVGDDIVAWTLKLERDRTSFAGTKPISKYAAGLRDQFVASQHPTLPVIANIFVARPLNGSSGLFGKTYSYRAAPAGRHRCIAAVTRIANTTTLVCC